MTLVSRLTLVAAGAAAVAALGGCSKGAADDADLVNGKKLFVQRCGSCHIMQRAGTKGTQGPSLDSAYVQALREGFGRSSIRAMVREQIDIPMQPDGRDVQMPADLVEGQDADDVAAYVAFAAAKKGKDPGLLATAVQTAESAEPAVAKNGELEIPADPNGQLLFVNNKATAPPGQLRVKMPNPSSVPHDINIDGKGDGEIVEKGGVSEFSASFTPGEYTYYCEVQGHREAGMEGVLTVK